MPALCAWGYTKHSTIYYTHLSNAKYCYWISNVSSISMSGIQIVTVLSNHKFNQSYTVLETDLNLSFSSCRCFAMSTLHWTATRSSAPCSVSLTTRRLRRHRALTLRCILHQTGSHIHPGSRIFGSTMLSSLKNGGARPKKLVSGSTPTRSRGVRTWQKPGPPLLRLTASSRVSSRQKMSFKSMTNSKR